MDYAARIDEAGKPRLFDNPFLERLSHSSAATVALIWSALTIALVVAGCWLEAIGPVRFVAEMVGVFFAWTLIEYCIHRFLFHLDRRFVRGQRLAFIVHGCHHVDPQDATRDIMPVPASLPVFLGFFVIFALLLPLPWALRGFGFIAFSYMTYDLTHYACHQLPMKSRLARALKRHHLQHHFRHADRNFAVTFPLWDRVFGTAGPR